MFKGFGQKLTGRNIRSLGQKGMQGLKAFGTKAMGALAGVRDVAHAILPTAIKAAEYLAPEIGIPAAMIGKAYDYMNKGENVYKKAQGLNKIVQSLPSVGGIKKNPLMLKGTL